MKTVDLSTLKPNPRNPRRITDAAFTKLRKLVEDYPRFLELRPIIVDAAGMIVAGHQRWRALMANGKKDVPAAWVRRASDFTADELKTFAMIDNAPDGASGAFDWDILSADWKIPDLEALGLEIEKAVDELNSINPELTQPATKLEIEKADDELNRPKHEDMAEDNTKLKKFIEAREKGRERGVDKGEVNFWVCLVFQSWEQKQEFLANLGDVPTQYGMYADGEMFAAACGKPVTPNTQKPHNVPIDKTLSGMVMP